MNKQQLIKTLSKIVYNEPIDCDIDLLLDAMLRYIGDSNPTLRDKLIYVSFCKLILNGEVSNEKLVELFKTLQQDEYLFYEIHKRGKGVYKRSFSTLILALLLEKNLIEEFLLVEEIKICHKNTLKYIKTEHDFHGYTKQYGWSHTVAHSADLLNSLAKQDAINYIEVTELLYASRRMIINDTFYLTNFENERYTTFVITSLNDNKLNPKDIQKYISSIDISNLNYEEVLIHTFNYTNLISSLYFALCNTRYHSLIDFVYEENQKSRF